MSIDYIAETVYSEKSHHVKWQASTEQNWAAENSQMGGKKDR